MAVSLNVGQTAPLSIEFLDQNGNPMTVTPDSPPVWTDGTTGIATLTVEPGSMTASLAAVAAGMDTITLTAVVAGVTYSASLSVTVSVPSVLTSIEILVGAIV